MLDCGRIIFIITSASPPCDTWDTDKWSPSVSLSPWSYVWAQVVRVQSLYQCCEPWMSGQLSKARWRPRTEAAGGVNVLVIIQLMALSCQHLRLGDPERDQTTSQLHYLDMPINLFPLFGASDFKYCLMLFMQLCKSLRPQIVKDI